VRIPEGSQTDERKSGRAWQSRWTKVQQRRHRQKGIYANQSRDVDSRKLFLSVMLDQGRQRRLRKQMGIVMQTKVVMRIRAN
jgi:hypothetical protein